MKSYFINPETGILRSAWRLLSFIIIFFSINLSLMFTVRSILGSLKAAGTIWFLLLGISATLAVFINRKFVRKKSFSSLGIEFNSMAIKNLGIGVLISAIIMAFMFLLLLTMGLIQFDGLSWWRDDKHSLGPFEYSGFLSMTAVLLQFIIVAWWEELVFRGVMLQNISEGLNLKWGVILSTLAFGLVHAGNPNSTILSTIIIIIVSLQLVYAYLKSATLWLPIGLHLGWNFFQASIFGFASSGHRSPSLIAQTPVGIDWLSGGEFGAEHSIFIIPLTLASFYLIHIWVNKSKNLKDARLTDLLVSNATLNTDNQDIKSTDKITKQVISSH